MVIYKKVCGICGSEFNGGAPNAKYCSEVCKKEAKRRSQRKFWKKQNRPWFQQDVGYNSGDPSDARVLDSKDPLESGDHSAGNSDGPYDDIVNPDSKDPLESGDPPAGSSGDPGDDQVPDSKDPLGQELSKVTRETKPSNPDSKDPLESGDLPAGSKQSFLDEFFEWLGW